MDAEHESIRSLSGPAGGGRFGWGKLALWVPACLLLGALVSRASVVAEAYGRPFLLFPLLVGVGLGAMTVGMMRLLQVGNRPTILLGTVSAAAVTVAGQHYFGYLAAWEAYHQQAAKVEMARQAFPDAVKGRISSPPANVFEFLREDAAAGRPLPGGYVARGWGAWASWAVDGLLVLATTLAMVIPAGRQPYCNRCRSWYRVNRSGRIDVPTAGRLAQIAEVAPAEQPTAARYRLLNCNGGCGPTGFELSWDKSPSGTSSVRLWLDPERRNQMVQVLDEATKVSRDLPLEPSQPNNHRPEH